MSGVETATNPDGLQSCASTALSDTIKSTNRILNWIQIAGKLLVLHEAHNSPRGVIMLEDSRIPDILADSGIPLRSFQDHQTLSTMITTKALLVNIALVILCITGSFFLWSYLTSALRGFPGSAPVAFTNIWRLWDVYCGGSDKTHINLHRKHGSAVRIGPSVLSLSEPSLISRVYTAKGTWTKVRTYPDP